MADSFDWSKAAEPDAPAEKQAPAFDWSSAAKPAEGPGFFSTDTLKRGANALVRAETAPLGPLALLAPQFDMAPMEATGTGGAIVRGVQKGASLGFADEDAGARAAAQEMVRGGGLTKALAKYREARDAERGADQRAHDVSPTANTLGEIGGALLTPVPFGKARAATLAGKLGLGALRGSVLGAGYGLGDSGADLTKGDVGGAATDTGIGGLAGLGGGVIGEGLGMLGGKVLKKVASRAQKGTQDAIAEEVAAQTAKKEKAVRAATGGLGGESAAGIKTIERLEQAAADQSLPPEIRKAAADHLASPEMQALKARALGNYVEKAPEQMGRIQFAEQKLADARNIDIQATTDDALANPVKRHVLPRAVTLANRYMPAIAGAVGYALGGPEGAAIGGALGTVQSLTQGAPGRALKNMIDKPAVRKTFWEALYKASGGSAAVQGAIPALEQSAQQGEKALASTISIFAQSHPEIRDAFLKVAGGGSDKPPELAANL
jgi:hypothetical protein